MLPTHLVGAISVVMSREQRVFGLHYKAMCKMFTHYPTFCYVQFRMNSDDTNRRKTSKWGLEKK